MPAPLQHPTCHVYPSQSFRRPGPQRPRAYQVTRQRFLEQQGAGGGGAPEPELCTSTSDLWTDPRVSRRVHEPWTGETWSLEKGCLQRKPAYPVELMPAGPEGEETRELADNAASILMKILYGARMGR